MTDLLVSAIVPVCGGERFLGAALESIFAQDYRPIEVIVVDDGSEDDTARIARSFADVHYLWQHNQGPAAARNAGISVARGEFIAFLDHDDLMAPHKLSLQVGYLLDHPEIGCVLTRQAIFLEPGTAPPPWLQRDSIFGDLGGIQPLSALVRRSVFEQAGLLDSAYRVAEGIEWLGRVREAGVKIGVLPEVLVYRRVHGSNLSHQNRAMQAALLKAMKGKIDRRRAAKHDASEAP